MIDKLRTTLRDYQTIRRSMRAYAMVEDGPVTPKFSDDQPTWDAVLASRRVQSDLIDAR